MRLHLHEWGKADAPAVVCLHGVTGHGERFRKLAQERLGDFRVVAPDLRGHGRSGWEPPWNLETHVDDLLDTVGALGLRRAHWLGFSFGGRLAAEVACSGPERVERLVLLDPALELPPALAFEFAEEERAGQTFASPEEAIETALAGASIITSPRDLLEEEMRQHLVRRADGRFAYRYSPSAAVAILGDLSRPAPPVARVPTLLVLGSESYVPGEEQAERYRMALGADVEVHTLHSGHSVLLDAFEAVARLVAEFLRRPAAR